MTTRPVSTYKCHELSWYSPRAATHQQTAQRSILQLPTDQPMYKVLKSITDLLLAGLLLPLALALGLGIAVLVKISSPGPIFFRHRRIGAGLRPFLLWKFRTMFHGSHDSLPSHLARHPEACREWARHRKLRYDPRVTPIGRFLRRTNLDEIPQLINVFTGEMSMVGPRPVVEEELTHFGAGQSLYAAAKPGMTGLWQVSGRASLPYERRVALDVEYVATWSLLNDFRVLIRTFGAIWNARGVY